MKKLIMKLFIILSLVSPATAQWGYGQWLETATSEIWFDKPPQQYDADAVAYWTAFTTPASDGFKTLINAFFVGIKADGVWVKLKAAWWIANETQQAATINLVNPATYTLVLVSSPTFTVNEGISGNGSSSYINTTYPPSDGSLNSFAFGVYSRTDNTPAYGVDMGVRESFQVNQTTLSIRNSSNTTDGSINANTGIGSTHTSSLGFFVASRVASDSTFIYRNGSLSYKGASVSTSRYTTAMTIGAMRQGASTIAFHTGRQYSFGFIAEGLTATDVSNLTTRVETIMDALGKGVIAMNDYAPMKLYTEKMETDYFPERVFELYPQYKKAI